MRFPKITGYRESIPVQLALTQGAYTAQSVIAEAQRCINLYPEQNPSDAPFPTTHYPTPGLVSWADSPSTPPIPNAGRGIYYSTRGQLFVAVAQTLYYVDGTATWNAVGQLDGQVGPVNMVDNGQTLMVVDGPSAEQELVSPTNSVTSLPYSGITPPPIGYPSEGNLLTFPGVLEFGLNFAATSTVSSALILLATPGSSPNTPNGYQILVDLNSGEQLVQLQKAVSGTLTTIGTYTQPVNAASINTGTFNITCVIGAAGAFTIYVNGILYVTATDTTFSSFGQTYYYAGTGTTVATIGPVKAVNPSIYMVDLSTYEFAKVTNPAIYGGTHVDYIDTFFVINSPGTQQFYITTSNVQLVDATQGPINALSLTAGGSNYANGTFANVPLTGGHGTGAQATLTVSGGSVTAQTLTLPGSGYQAGDVLSAALSSTAGVGPVIGLTMRFAGSKLVAGTYTNLALSGGTGSGATATVVANTFGVTSFTLTAGGTGYTAGDILTAPVPLQPYKPSPEPGYYADPTFVASVAPGTAGSGLQLTVNSISLLNAVNALNIASKTGFPDLLQGLLIVHRELWLFGRQTTEVWYDAGTPDFPFGIENGVFLQRGLLAPYSLAKYDLSPFWLGEDQTGRAMVFAGIQYNAVRISTFAIEQEIQTYSRLNDAWAFVYQQNGHAFYVLNFPSADATWVYDMSTQLWHQRGTVDQDGTVHRGLPCSYANAYGKDVVQRYDTGDLVLYDTAVYDELGEPVTRIRGFPHIKKEMRRIVYNHFIADMEVGQPIGPNTASAYPRSVLLRWSDDGGQTWSDSVSMNLTPGKFNQLLKWNRLGMGRDRVFEIEWTAAVRTALNGAWLTMVMAES